MLRLKGKSLLFDFFILLVLVLLVKYAYQLLHKPSHTPISMVPVTHEETIEQPSEPSLVTQKNRAHLSEKTRNLLSMADVLINQLHHARSTLDKDLIIENSDRDMFIADIKTNISHIEHVIEEFEQDPLHGQALLGPTGSSTRIVYERSLHKKLVQYAQETEKIFIRLYNELQGHHKPVEPAPSLQVCISHIKQLSAQLS